MTKSVYAEKISKMIQYVEYVSNNMGLVSIDKIVAKCKGIESKLIDF
jgi:hypothetical protein